jgi:hypothetical protein
METIEKDCRNPRFIRVNFKKRDNQRELNCRLQHSLKRIDQSFFALFGNKYDDQKYLNTVEKLLLIKKEKEIPKKIRKFFRENPIIPAEA